MRNCFVNSEDDGLCFKGASGRTMENVLVENSRFYSTCNAIKFGTDSQGGFRNVLIRNVEVGGPSDDMPAKTRRTAISGISWESVDGGILENIRCENIRIVRTRSPIFLRLASRGRMMPGQDKKIGAIRRIAFDGVTGESSGPYGSSIVGIPGAIIEDVVIRNVAMTGRRRRANAGAINPKKEDEGDYPEATMFGDDAGSTDFGCATRLTFRCSTSRLRPRKPDARPLVSAEQDVRNVLLNGTADCARNSLAALTAP